MLVISALKRQTGGYLGLAGEPVRKGGEIQVWQKTLFQKLRWRALADVNVWPVHTHKYTYMHTHGYHNTFSSTQHMNMNTFHLFFAMRLTMLSPLLQ